MRSIVFALTLALAASGPLAAVAQAPVTTQPLAQGEVLVEINALGLVSTRADRATLTLTVSGSGETEARARAEAERNAGEVRALLRGQGVADADISLLPVSSYTTDVMTMENSVDVADDTNANATGDVPTAPTATANAAVEVVFRNVARVPAVQAALAQRGFFAVQAPVYMLTDDSAARRQARTLAMRNARADAEAYAAAINMRVARVVRVTERLGLDLLGMMVSESQIVANLFSVAAMRTTGPDVQTMVTVGVDFALAPR